MGDNDHSPLSKKDIAVYLVVMTAFIVLMVFLMKNNIIFSELFYYSAMPIAGN